LHLFLGNGDGTFGGPFGWPIVVGDGGGNSVLIADLDGDTHPDVATVAPSGVVQVLPGQGDGTFGRPLLFCTWGSSHMIIAAGDFNLDSRLDLVNSSEARDAVSVLLNQSGPSTFSFLSDRVTLVWPAVIGALTYDMYRGDLSGLVDGNGDGLPDDGYGTCMTGLDDDPRDTFFIDPDMPSSGDGFFYLMSVVDAGGDGGLGTTSAGLARVPEVPCP
jgi:hypothetical protein